MADTPGYASAERMMKSVKGIDFNEVPYRLERRAISQEEIEASKTSRGAWVRSTLLGWGVPFPPPQGWLSAIKKYGVPLFDIDPKSYRRPKKICASKKATSRKQPAGSIVGAEKRKEFYLSWEWRTLRMEVIKEHGARCQCCGAGARDLTVGGTPVRICVDHIKPISKYWHLRLERSNLQILCDECNQGKGAWDETDWRVNEAIKAQLQYSL